MPTKRALPDEGSPYVRLLLGTGEAPAPRVRGWVQCEATGGSDRVPLNMLVGRYGAALRRECAGAGFEPACDRPLREQSAVAQRAASTWAEAVIREGAY